MGKTENLILYDVLTRQKKEQDFSLWKGQSGDIFFFKHKKTQKEKAPIAQVFKNRKYMTGLFPTQKPNIFLGDIKTDQTRIYVLFTIENQQTIKIFKKI